MFLTGLTRTFYKNFTDEYVSTSNRRTSHSAFVYVDEMGIKFLTELVDEENPIFAYAIAGDGNIEILSIE